MILGYLAVAGLVAVTACRTAERDAAQPPVAAQSPAPPSAPVAEAGGAPVVLVIGTSLTAGLGVDPDQAYPALLQRKADSAGLAVRVVNAGVSGETSAGALRRLEWVLRQPAAVVVIETGANDGLRGQDPDSVRANIQQIIDRVRALQPRPRVLLVGMEAMPNLGADYAGRFRAIYPALARRNGVPLVPFLLEGVAGVDSLNQPDGIHPTAEGQRRVAATVWRYLEPLLRSLPAA